MTPRSFIEISGPDRIAFLQGLLTQDVTKLAENKLLFAALLSPQGKILHDMFLFDLGESILLDTPQFYAPTLIKRLNMYKLRAQVSIVDVSDQWRVVLGDGLPDPRHLAMPPRHYTQDASVESTLLAPQRVSLGIPDSAKDFAPDSITAMDGGYDLLHAISFTKGCYVGQEVTARMHYKAIARKGFFVVEAEDDLAPDAIVAIGGKPMSAITSHNGKQGLIFLKFEDGLNPAATVNHRPVRLHAPEWMQPKIAAFAAAETIS